VWMTPPHKGSSQNESEGAACGFHTAPPINNTATEKIFSKRVQRGRHVDIMLPPINNTAMERISPKQVQEAWHVDFTLPPINNATTGRIYPLMRGFNKVEGSACRLSHCPVVDTSSSRIFGRDGCNRGSGKDHAALRCGVAFANGLAVRRGQWA